MSPKSNLKLNWKYAIGEVVLIFIGITMAFGLQQWANERNSFRKSLRYIEAFQIELESNIQTIKDHIEATQEDYENLKYYIELVNSDSASSITDSTITTMVQYLGPPYYQSLSVSAYQDIINSGGIELIEDNSLRRELIKYGVHLEAYHSRVENSYNSWNEILSPYFLAHADLSKMNLQGMTFNFPENVFYNDKDAFVRNRVFTNILRSRIIQQYNVVGWSSFIIKDMESFNQIINEYLDP